MGATFFIFFLSDLSVRFYLFELYSSFLIIEVRCGFMIARVTLAPFSTNLELFKYFPFINTPFPSMTNVLKFSSTVANTQQELEVLLCELHSKGIRAGLEFNLAKT